jgi:hypothetical protein
MKSQAKRIYVKPTLVKQSTLAGVVATGSPEK